MRQRRRGEEDKEVESDVQKDERELERGELQGSFLVAEIGEQNGLECIQRNDTAGTGKRAV